MDGEDTDEEEQETLARQEAANELQQEYDWPLANDFVPAFDIADESSDGPACDLDVDFAYDPYPPQPSSGPAA
eukprot:7734068-Heterocapsa_arctica.AAC.1